MAQDLLSDEFLKEPLFQRNYVQRFGTLFTAIRDPNALRLTLRWPNASLAQSLDAFGEGRRAVMYHSDESAAPLEPAEFPVDLEGVLGFIKPHLPQSAGRAFEDLTRNTRTGVAGWAEFGKIFSAS
jgi:hypothetical protein